MGLLLKTKCLVKKDLKLMMRSCCWTIFTMILPFIFLGLATAMAAFVIRSSEEGNPEKIEIKTNTDHRMFPAVFFNYSDYAWKESLVRPKMQALNISDEHRANISQTLVERMPGQNVSDGMMLKIIKNYFSQRRYQLYIDIVSEKRKLDESLKTDPIKKKWVDDYVEGNNAKIGEEHDNKHNEKPKKDRTTERTPWDIYEIYKALNKYDDFEDFKAYFEVYLNFRKTQCYSVTNYLDGERIQWNETTRSATKTGEKNTPERFIKEGEDYMTRDTRRHCEDVLFFGYFIETETKKFISTFPDSAKLQFGFPYYTHFYHYRMRMIQYALDENATTLHLDGVYPFPTIKTVISMKDVVLYLFPKILSVLLLLSLLPVIVNLLNEKKVIQPYFQSIGLQPWFFYSIHYLNGAIRLFIWTNLVILAMWFLNLNINYPIFFLGSFLFMLGTTAFGLLIGTIFKTPLFSLLMLLVLWMLSITSAILLRMISSEIPLSVYKIVMFIMNLNVTDAYVNFASIVKHARMTKVDLEWFQTYSVEDYPLIVYASFMIFDTIWMITLGIFWDDIASLSSNIITKLRFGSKVSTVDNNEESRKSENDDDGYLDNAVLECQDLPMRKDLKVGIELKNAGKVYSNGYRALNGVTMRAMNGQVTCLLGANGAGKSTIFSMITNITQPTHGTVRAYSDDTGINKFGYCPQYNPIFEKLTVIEHLQLAEVLKNSPCVDFGAESTELLTLVGLNGKQDVLAGQLSGGMKRKLCVCMAMIGGSQIVLLDEPTAGMDPAARRDIQRMLNECKKDRTILLTTHFMDEAEAVGDWVLVLTDGKLAAAGTSSHLKKTFFDGFLTNVVVSDKHPIETSAENMKALFEHCLPGSSMMSHRGLQFEFYVPNQLKETFADFLLLLEDIASENFSNPKLIAAAAATDTELSTYSVETFGLSETTLEQVLLTICAKMGELGKPKDDKKIDMTEANYKALVEAKNEVPHSGFGSVSQQVYSLLAKRFAYATTHIGNVLFAVIIPLFFIWKFASSVYYPDEVMREYSLANLDYGVAVVQFNGTENKQILDYLGTYSNLDVRVEPFMADLEPCIMRYNAGKQKLNFIMQVYDNQNVIYFEKDIKNAVELFSNVVANLKYLKSPKNPRIEDYKLYIRRIITHKAGTQGIIFLVIMFFGLALSISFVPSLMYLIDERRCQFDLMQRLTGASTMVLYGANVLHELIYFMIIVIFSYSMFLWYGIYQQQFLLVGLCFLIFFLNMVALIYSLAKLFKSSAICLIMFVLYQVFLPSPLLKVYNLELFHINSEYWYFLNPVVLFSLAMGKIYCSPIDDLESFSASRRGYYFFDELWGENGLQMELYGMAGQFAIFVTFLLTCNSQMLRVAIHRFFYPYRNPRPSVNPLTNNCEALKREQKLIDDNDGQPADCPVVVDKLVQTYATTRALNGTSFTVRASECFGLLGVNGAGKTTTFDILTGTRLSRGGKVTIDGVDVMKDITIGFCPQVDALMDYLTGKQCFYLFARLHRYNDVDEVVRVLLECVGMTEHRNKQLQRMSGGQRRRISIGVAILSRSHCMILDEPTTGIDPIVRRELWNVLNNVLHTTGTSIILTSHSMDECQALCNRITILQKGEMVALGTSQEYMTEYGEFFTVVFTVSDQSNREAVVQKTLETLQNSKLHSTNIESQQNIYFKWEKKVDDKWSDKFGEVARLAMELNCDDFMLTQATLEDAVVKLTGGQMYQKLDNSNVSRSQKSGSKSKEAVASDIQPDIPIVLGAPPLEEPKCCCCSTCRKWLIGCMIFLIAFFSVSTLGLRDGLMVLTIAIVVSSIFTLVAAIKMDPPRLLMSMIFFVAAIIIGIICSFVFPPSWSQEDDVMKLTYRIIVIFYVLLAASFSPLHFIAFKYAREADV